MEKDFLHHIEDNFITLENGGTETDNHEVQKSTST